MTCTYIRSVRNLLLVFPTVAVGRSGLAWFIEAAWLRLSIGVIIFQEK